MYTSKTIAIAAAALLLSGCEAAKSPAPQTPELLPPGPDQDVLLVWKQATSEWKVRLNNGNEQSPATARTALNKVGPTKFVVRLAAPAAITFRDPNGLDVWEGINAKSQPKSGINSNQILGPIVTSNGRVLIFYDLMQPPAVNLNYQLHFNNGFPSVDPIIENNP